MTYSLIQLQSIYASDIPAPQQPSSPHHGFSAKRDKVLSDRRDHNHWRLREGETKHTRENGE